MVFKRLKEMVGGSTGGSMREEAEKKRDEMRREEASRTSTATASPEPVFVPPEPSAPASSVEPAVGQPGTASSDQGAVAEPLDEEQAPVEAQQETYRVEAGDSLSAIAQRVYGDAGQYMRIFEANREKLDNPDMIHPGQELVIPR